VTVRASRAGTPAEREILEEVAGIGFRRRHAALMRSMASRWRRCGRRLGVQQLTMRPSTVITPCPCSGLRERGDDLRAKATSAAGGANTRGDGTWSGGSAFAVEAKGRPCTHSRL